MPAARRRALSSSTRPHPRAVVVRATTGLEQLLEAEVTEAGHAVVDRARRQLVVAPADGTILDRPPRLADDLFLVAAEAPDPGPARRDLEHAVDALRPRVDLSGPFAVSASFVGRRRYTRFDIEDAVGRVLARWGAGTYASRRDGAVPPPDALAWRVTLDGATLRVGRRPYAAPLHRRPWRTRTVVGSVHPPVAAAMARLADLRAGARVLDPCCGAGTLLVEAHEVAPTADHLGLDRDPAAVAAARHNARGRGIAWRVGDAAATGLPSGSVDRVVTNPPWGVRRSAGDLVGFLAEWRRVLRADGRLVVLLDEGQEPVLLEAPGWHVERSLVLSVAGRHPRVVVARPR